MKLFLIRHAETVDNVAGLYAGTRDSKLTNHGVEQARRLGQFFAQNDVNLTHLFSSPLTRTFKTAQAVQKMQTKVPEIVKIQELIERGFGFYEGKPFAARADPKSPGGEVHNEEHKNKPGFVDLESKEAMAVRIDTFLDQHICPLLEKDSADEELVVAVVSHGMLLSHFWQRLLLRLPRKSLMINPEITTARGHLALEHVGGWSNTGYLELSIRKDEGPEAKPTSAAKSSDAEAQVADIATLQTPIPPPLQSEDAQVSIDKPQRDRQAVGIKTAHRKLTGCSTTVLAIDNKQHLIGLKRQRGGIGSLAYDEGQKKLDGFFKRPKLS